MFYSVKIQIILGISNFEDFCAFYWFLAWGLIEEFIDFNEEFTRIFDLIDDSFFTVYKLELILGLIDDKFLFTKGLEVVFNLIETIYFDFDFEVILGLETEIFLFFKTFLVISGLADDAFLLT